MPAERAAVSAAARPLPAMTALLLAEVSAAFETAMIYAALNKLIAHFGDPVRVGWLVTTYLLVGAGAAAVAGRLGDVFGRKRVTQLLLLGGAVGAAISASTDLFAVVLLGRIIQGGTGAILPLAIGIVRETMPPARIPVCVGWIVSGAGVGTAAGLVIGGLIVDHFSWRGIFVMSAVLCTISFVAMQRLVPPSVRVPREGRLDWLGGVLFVPAIGGILLYISNGRSWGWTNGSALLLLAGSTALLAVWIVQALRSPAPLIDIRLFANRKVMVANLVAALISMSALQITLVFSMLLQAPVWTGIGLGVSATAAGLAKLPSNISSAIAAPISGAVTARVGGRAVMAFGGVVSTLGWLLAWFFHDAVWQVVLILMVISFGATVLYAVGPNIIVEAVPADRTSEAVGMMTVVRQASIGIGAQMVAVLLATETVVGAGGSGARYPTARAFDLTIVVILALSIAATLISLALPRHRTMPATA